MLLLATPTVTAQLAAAHLPLQLPDAEEPAICAQCGNETPDADTAREQDGWVQTEDGELLCEDCATTDRPTGPYDPAYYG